MGGQQCEFNTKGDLLGRGGGLKGEVHASRREDLRNGSPERGRGGEDLWGVKDKVKAGRRKRGGAKL